MSIKDGRNVKTRGMSRRNRKAYTKCRKHLSCRNMPNSIWRKI